MASMTVNAYEIRFIGELERIAIKPGDKFVITCPHELSFDTMRRIQGQWREFAGDGVEVVILTGGMQLGVIADPQSAKEPAA